MSEHIATYQPNPKQAEGHADVESKAKCFVGSVGSGKSHWGCWEVIFNGAGSPTPGGRWLVSRQTYRTLEDTTKQRFREIAIANKLLKQEIRSEDTFIMRGEAGDWTVLFRSLDDPAKFGSLELAGFFIDEADESNELTFDTLMGRLRQLNQPHKAILACNHTLKTHWLYQRFVARPKEGYRYWENSTDENKHNLPADYLQHLESMSTTRRDWYRRFVKGEWGVEYGGRSYYPEWNNKLHAVSLQYNKREPIRRSWDFGFHHPAVLFAQYDIPLDRLGILREYMGEDEPLEKTISRIKVLSQDWFPGAVFLDYCDAAGIQTNDSGRTSVQTLREHSILPRFSKQPILQGVKILRRLLTTLVGDTPQLVVDPACRILIDGFEGGYQLTKIHMGAKQTDLPEKDGYYEHLQDSLRYMIVGIYGMQNLDKEKMKRYKPRSRVTGY